MDSPTQTPQPKKTWFSAHHVLGYTFLIVVAGAILAGLYYWQVTQNLPQGYQVPIVHKDQASNGQTYANTTYSYSISLPPGWATGDGTLPKADASIIGFVDQTGGQVTIFTVQDDSCSDLHSCMGYHQMQYNAGGDRASNLTYQSLTSASETFSFNGAYYQTYYFYHNKTFYTVSFNTTDQNKDTSIPVFNQILSTFKFTN